MRITNIRLEYISRGLDPPFEAAWDPTPRETSRATLVLVETDEGVTGIGSGDDMSGFGKYAHLFVGEDPTNVNRHVRVLETLAFHSKRFWPFEAALWDLFGKTSGQPAFRLFGGARDRIPAYASFGSLMPPEARAEAALAAKERGFRAMKLRVDPRRLEEGISTVRAVREAVGDSVEIMVDLNQAWRMAGDPTPPIHPTDARNIALRLSEFGVFWLEEPLPLTDVAGLRSLRFPGSPRIAGGEMASNPEELLRLLREDALDVFQPDVVLSVGMTRSRTIAELALLSGRSFTPHTWTDGGVGLLANLHVVCGVGGGPYLEYPYDPPGWTPEARDFLLAEPVAVDSEGYVHVPDRPGLGIELAEEVSASLGRGEEIRLRA
jgi:D-galactarolactone cycloisomerase